MLMFRIITVCTGNICRSPMAERMLASALIDAGLEGAATVDSAGTHDYEVGRPIDPRASHKLDLHGIDSTTHRAREFDPRWFEERDLILALNVDHYQDLLALAPDEPARTKIHMLRDFDPAVSGQDAAMQGIEDPWFGGATDFETSWDQIAAALPGIIDYVRQAVSDRR